MNTNPNNLLADISVPITGGSGPLANPGADAGNLFASIISGAIGVMTIIAAIWFLFNIITGGIDIIGAGGDKAKVEGARTKITNGALGFIVIISASALLGLLAFILGIDNPLDVNAWIGVIAP